MIALHKFGFFTNETIQMKDFLNPNENYSPNERFFETSSNLSFGLSFSFGLCYLGLRVTISYLLLTIQMKHKSQMKHSALPPIP